MDYLSTMNNSSSLFLALHDNKSNLHFGNISLYLDRHNDLAEISILLSNKKFRILNGVDKKISLDVWTSSISFLFDQMSIRKISAGTMLVNKSMIKLFESSNMKHESTFYNHYIFEGKPVDLVFYSIYHS